MCSACDDTGLVVMPDSDGQIITVCGNRGCGPGQRIAKVLMAIAKREPIIFRDTLAAGFQVEPIEPSAIIGPTDKIRKVR